MQKGARHCEAEQQKAELDRRHCVEAVKEAFGRYLLVDKNCGVMIRRVGCQHRAEQLHRGRGQTGSQRVDKVEDSLGRSSSWGKHLGLARVETQMYFPCLGLYLMEGRGHGRGRADKADVV